MLKALVGLLALGSAGFGLFAMFQPARTGLWVGFTLEDAAASGEVRAVYGGLVLGLGVVMGWALLRPDGAHWLRAMGFCFFGLVVGRIASLALDGPTAWNASAMVLEGGAGALLLVAAHRLQPKVPRASSDDSAGG